MNRATTLCFMLALLLSSMLSFATSSIPTSLPNPTITKSENKGVEESCEGVGREECLMRRILADAHLDYIYTQDKNP
ncbi:phytosulfokines-like [Cynara cardunculus var. scolymus]|uniref:Phytosulfokine n=1 Tax=Cynara cardunculus var. scolymus TaxID=59895 RepID=A0A103XKT2_CYNCS|nr:phytosulfokines-like [Cynara cardunculus var. scolymus]KVH92468.1 Phytosulfokine [Cynara cardunculus var. scolymus]